VFGSLIDGVFEGKIVSPKGSYFVEKAHHYFPRTTHPNSTFHSVIYHEDHVQDPYEHVREGEFAYFRFCLCQEDQMEIIRFGSFPVRDRIDPGPVSDVSN
jgi:hypothetical protein